MSRNIDNDTTFTMSIPKLAALLLTTLVLPTPTKAQKDNNAANCDCYLTNGSTPSYFQYHTFDDFRNIDSEYVAVPTALKTASANTNADVASNYFSSDWWTSRWDIQKWNNSDSLGTGATDASVLMVNSANNVYVEHAATVTSSYKTHLTLRTNRQAGFQSTSEIDSIAQNYLYLSARFYARVIGSEGACAGMFTYRSPTGVKKRFFPDLTLNERLEERSSESTSSDAKVQEADIEILTSGPRNVVQYTNQPSNSPTGNVLTQATANQSLPNALDWSEWNLYRLDWTKGLSEWYVNGIRQAKISFQAPTDPAQLIMNMWSDGGSWAGNMSVNDYAYLQIQYMEVVFNTSGPAVPSSRKREEGSKSIQKMVKREQKGCKVVCSVDSTSVVGTPVLLVNNTAAATRIGSVVDVSQWRLLGACIFLASLTYWL